MQVVNLHCRSVGGRRNDKKKFIGQFVMMIWPWEWWLEKLASSRLYVLLAISLPILHTSYNEKGLENFLKTAQKIP